ncbi:hypothetical protein ACWGB8_23075 [Kitasatospora sp. NPDC054939]
MPVFDRFTLAIVDNVRDRDHAPDGRSRYGAHIAQYADDFHEDGQPLRPVDFAALAWSLATFPVMSPGYMTMRPDVHIDVYRDHNGGATFCAKVGLRHAALARRPDHRLHARDWERVPAQWPDGAWPVLVNPERTDRPAVLLTATILLPIPDHVLIRPTTARPGRTLTWEAKAVIASLADHANQHLTPLVDDLLAPVGR